MRVLSRKEKAKGVAAQWRAQYYRNGHWNHYGVTDKEATFLSLIDLGPQPQPDDVDRVIGNGSWTRCSCDECGDSFEEVVQVGQDPDYESSTACLCFDCVLKALVIVHENRSNKE